MRSPRRSPLMLAMLAAGAVSAALIVLPRWSAAREQRAREAAFEKADRSGQSGPLLTCPPPGPDLDAFLAGQQGAGTPSTDLWAPVCRAARTSPLRITVVSTDRDQFSQCRALQRNPWARFDCASEEALRFLADPGQKRTWARRWASGGELLWMSSAPLAWDGRLVSEHRARLLRWLAMLFIGWTGWRGLRRSRLAAAAHRIERRANGAGLPFDAELALHRMLGERWSSLPGDLGEEYLIRLDAGGSKAEADRWYRGQVARAAFPVAAQALRRAIEGTASRLFFSRTP